MLVEKTRAMAQESGLVDVVLTPKPDYIDSMEDWKDAWYGSIIKLLPAGARLSHYVTSLSVEAHRAAKRGTR